MARDWLGLQRHFSSHPPERVDEFEARALTTMALLRGADGARAALPDLRRACALQPENVLLAANLMQALIDAGHTEEALRLTTGAVSQAPHVFPLADKHVWALVAAARWDAAEEASAHALRIATATGVPPGDGLVTLAAELATRWWRPLVMADIELRLPAADDTEFLARCCRDEAFMARFHRYQGSDDAAMAAFVERSTKRPSRQRRIDWVIHRGGTRIGLAGLVDHDAANRRAELLVGLPDAGLRGSAAPKAALAVLDFGFRRLVLRKVVSFVYGDNPAAQANTRHLGLREEGLLRAHLLGPQGPVDLHVNGLLAEEFHGDAKLQRMLRRWRR